MARIWGIFGVLALMDLAGAAQPEKLQSWRTMGASSPTGVAYGETLLDVEAAPGGSVVRLVYIGLRDTACRGITVMTWEKRISQSLSDLAGPLNLCNLARDVHRVVKRHPFDPLAQGIESDGQAVVIQCGGRQSIARIPLGVLDLPDGSADDRFMDKVWNLDERIKTAAWGDNPPNIEEIDLQAETDSAHFVARARSSGHEKEDPFGLLSSFLEDYKGPLSKPVHEWQIEPPPGVKILHQTEPHLYRTMYPNGIPSYATTYALTIDQHSGKVTKAIPQKGDDNWFMGRVLWGHFQNWVFDPSTVPADGMIEMHIHFNATCGERQ